LFEKTIDREWRDGIRSPFESEFGCDKGWFPAQVSFFTPYKYQILVYSWKAAPKSIKRLGMGLITAHSI
jgi:hypothetical protein